jgi:hypothetical protein
MEFIQENSLLYNITAGIAVLVFLLLILKLIKKVGETVLILICVAAVSYGIMRYFPGVAEPVVEFVKVGWVSYR